LVISSIIVIERPLFIMARRYLEEMRQETVRAEIALAVAVVEVARVVLYYPHL
jgi:hypothetical protein